MSKSKRSVEQAAGADVENELDAVAAGDQSVAGAVSAGVAGLRSAWRGSSHLLEPVVPGVKAPPRELWIRRYRMPLGTVVVRGPQAVEIESPDGTVTPAESLDAAMDTVGILDPQVRSTVREHAGATS